MSNSPDTTRRRNSAGPSRNAGPAPAPGFSISPKDLLRLFLERWWMGLIVAVPAVVLFIWLQPRPVPVYRTEASLLFETRQDRVLPVQAVVDTSISQATELNLHLEQIKSVTFFEYLQSSFTPDEIERIQRAYRDPLNPNAPPPSLGSIIIPNTLFYARKQTTIMGIVVTHRDPEAAALIANRYARKYIDFNLDRAMTGTNSAIVFLRSQAEETRQQVAEAERALQQYRERHNMAALGENQNVILQKVASLGSSLVQAQLEQVSLKAQLDKVDEQLRAGKDLYEISFISSFGAVGSLKNELDTLLAQRRQLEERYLEEHPQMKANQLALQDVRTRLQADLDRAVAELRNRHALSVAYEQKLRDELAEAENQARELDRISVDYKFLEQDVVTKRNTYNRIVDRLNDASISAQLENINIKIFDRALIPGAPAVGGRGRMAAQASALGVFLLIVIPLGIGLLDTRVKTTEDVETKLGTHLIGGVKVMRDVEEANRPNVFREAADDSVAESYRGIYSEIEIRSKVPFPKALLITSGVPHEGKSVTASNLAAVFAAHGRRTLLVDCDFRRPSLHRMFGLPNDRGLLAWFKGHTPDEVARATDDELGVREIAPQLYLLTAGGFVKKPTEIIEQLSNAGVVKRLLQGFDLVVIDTPPAAVFPDALLLARGCAETLYVCKFKTVRRGTVKKVLNKLAETGTIVLGIVMNSLPRSAVMNYDYEGYGAYEGDYYRAYEGSGKEK